MQILWENKFLCRDTATDAALSDSTALPVMWTFPFSLLSKIETLMSHTYTPACSMAFTPCRSIASVAHQELQSRFGLSSWRGTVCLAHRYLWNQERSTGLASPRIDQKANFRRQRKPILLNYYFLPTESIVAAALGSVSRHALEKARRQTGRLFWGPARWASVRLGVSRNIRG